VGEMGEEWGGAPVSPPSAFRLPPSVSVSVLDGITALVERSLIRPAIEVAGEVRYGMLETLREFGVEQLVASGEEVTIRQAHAAWYLALAERADIETRGPDQTVWGGRLEADRGNCRAALAWAIERADAATALRLAAALGPVWLGRGPYSEGRSWLERALRLGDSPSRARVAALVVLSRLVFLQGDYPRAAALGEEALEFARAIGDQLGSARALIAVGEAVDRQGDLDRSLRCHEEALALFRDAGESRGVAETLSHLGVVAWLHDDVDRFAALAEETLLLCREICDRSCVIASLDRLSLAARIRGELARQAALASEMISLCAEVDDPFVLSSALWTAAAIADERGQSVLSARFFGAEDALRQATGFVLDPAFIGDHARAIASLRETLGPSAFASAWDAGHRLSAKQALAEATEMLDRLATRTDAPVDAASAHLDHNLTPREVEVLRLVIEGLTDREIADSLFIARRTASKHVESILGKLGVSSRGAAAAAAVRLGLL
jgi:ATP/maltotriose-dependent transcriptional regulator MalT